MVVPTYPVLLDDRTKKKKKYWESRIKNLSKTNAYLNPTCMENDILQGKDSFQKTICLFW